MSTETNISSQIETLKKSLKARDVDNQKLHSDVKATQEKLQKSEKSKQVLISSIVKLQDIVSSRLSLRRMCNDGYSRLAIPP